MKADQDNDWWRGCVIYQVYPRSFQDSNADGVGDLPGVLQRLEYIASLNVDAIWLSPFFRSPMKDFGYDVSDYRDVDPLFGKLEDFQAIIDRAHDLGIKVIIDQVLSHSSDQHEWFTESRQNRENPKADWYVWADAKPDGSPPNNWLSVFGGSAWTWDPRRAQYFLHNFLESQPDLNFHNPEVQQQLLDDVEFWLKLGVDGIRLDACSFYFHDRSLQDNPPVPADKEQTKGVTGANPYAMQQHIFDICQPENIDFHRRLRDLFNRYPGSASVGEIGADDALAVMAEYLEGGDKLFMAYTFDLLTTDYQPSSLRKIIETIESKLAGGWPCLSFSNHDVVRTASRAPTPHVPEQAKCLLALITSLRGSVCLYQGEELGLTEANIPYEAIQDPYGLPFWPEFKGRDGCRTPMPWLASGPYAGFSQSEPWLPISAEHRPLAVDQQDANPDSILNTNRQFLEWRQQWVSLQKGDFECVFSDEQCLVFMRSFADESTQQTMLVAVNLSHSEAVVTLPDAYRQVEPVGGHGFISEWQLAAATEPAIVTLPAWQCFFGLLS